MFECQIDAGVFCVWCVRVAFAQAQEEEKKKLAQTLHIVLPIGHTRGHENGPKHIIPDTMYFNTNRRSMSGLHKFSLSKMDSELFVLSSSMSFASLSSSVPFGNVHDTFTKEKQNSGKALACAARCLIFLSLRSNDSTLSATGHSFIYDLLSLDFFVRRSPLFGRSVKLNEINGCWCRVKIVKTFGHSSGGRSKAPLSTFLIIIHL